MRNLGKFFLDGRIVAHLNYGKVYCWNMWIKDELANKGTHIDVFLFCCFETECPFTKILIHEGQRSLHTVMETGVLYIIDLTIVIQWCSMLLLCVNSLNIWQKRKHLRAYQGLLNYFLPGLLLLRVHWRKLLPPASILTFWITQGCLWLLHWSEGKFPNDLGNGLLAILWP